MKIIDRASCARRREKILELMPEQSICVILANEHSFKNGDVHFGFRQDSNMFYFTGIEEADCGLILSKGKSNELSEILFVKDKNPELEMWEGELLGVSGAREFTGIDDIRVFDTFVGSFELLAKNKRLLYIDYSMKKHNTIVIELLKKTYQRIKELHSIDSLTGKLRLYKEESEINMIKKACSVSSDGFNKIFEIMGEAAGLYEWEIRNRLESYYLNGDTNKLAFETIIATASNATTLHYTKNNSILNSGDLLLIDSGCEWRYYASDISRVYPIGSGQSTAQRSLYNIVASAHASALNTARTNARYSEIHEEAVRVISQGLYDLGIIKESTNEIIDKKLYSKYFMHRVGHWLGLDVHDVGGYIDEDGHSMRFTEGMVMTIEPGIYIREDDDTVHHDFRGLGIRVEDTILKTKDNVENLSDAAKKWLAV